MVVALFLIAFGLFMSITCFKEIPVAYRRLLSRQWDIEPARDFTEEIEHKLGLHVISMVLLTLVGLLLAGLGIYSLING